MAEVSIRIPLGDIIAGNYKVALSPRRPRGKKPQVDLGIFSNDIGGWILPDGSMSQVTEDEAEGGGHADAAHRLGFRTYGDALEHGAVRVDLNRGMGGTLFEVYSLGDNTRSLLRGAMHEAYFPVTIEWWHPRENTAEFGDKEEALDWLENRTVFASKKTAVSLPELVQQTNAFSVKNRPGCAPQLKKSDPRNLFLQYQVTCHLKDSDPAGHEVNVKFDTTKIEETKRANDLDVQCSCSCPAFLYWGAQWNLHQQDGLLGEARPLLQAPTQRLDLRSNFVICKHCKAVFERILPSVQHNVNTLLRIQEMKRIEEEKKKPKEPAPPKEKPAPAKPSKEEEELLHEEEKRLLEEQQGIVKRTEPATPQEKREQPTATPSRAKKWIDRLKERIKGWGRPREEAAPTPEEQPQGKAEKAPPPVKETPPPKPHPKKPHLDKGLPYVPRWRTMLDKLKNRIKNWGKK